MKKKTKQILAWTGIILLAGLYILTLIFSLIDSPWAYNLFKFCIGMTIVLPCLIYAYIMIYRVFSKDKDE